MQVSIEKGMIENKNRLRKSPLKYKKNFLNLFFSFLHVSGPVEQKKNVFEIFQYTKNLENVHIPDTIKTKQHLYLLWILQTWTVSFEIWYAG